ncbi:hypothetical protein LC653_36645 [Nostoc sp. CHAB 5784]|uniref:hypothetical protein n=1 Tax=Nostoc mirabile TaxID=2907820 RepID=UPI001E311CAD|nr:hypothetical protein [Nostoc mirabile]MCC5669224.1 hypothetical protein [Nostoc mirabile CHAB5784]
MEQQQEQTRQKQLFIHLKKDGELNLSGLTLKNLTPEEFLILQQLIDESIVRSNNANRVEELMQRGMMAQGVVATFAILMFSFIGIYGIYRYIDKQVQQIQETYSNVR